jgi:hypothetical protein
VATGGAFHPEQRIPLPTFNPGHKAVLDDLLLGDPRVQPGKMFGYPGYYAGGKLCICHYGDAVGLKTPEETAKGLLADDPNVVPFQPMGKRKMREWIQINVDASEDYRQYAAVFEESIEYAWSLQKAGDARKKTTKKVAKKAHKET